MLRVHEYSRSPTNEGIEDNTNENIENCDDPTTILLHASMETKSLIRLSFAHCRQQ